ncbi:MipA/OmpV family protein [Kaarinaea lacus]
MATLLPKSIASFILSFILFMFYANIAFADELPLWEVSGGGGVLHIPDYRGSEEAGTYPYPFLIPFYRGKYFRSDEEGVRGELFKSNRIRFDVSYDGGVPVESEKNEARKNMPDLDATGQIGPALNIKLWQSASVKQTLIAFIPLRAAFSLSTSAIDHVGYTFSPHLWYHRKVYFLNGDWRFGVSAGLEFASEEFHKYYYQVDPQYETINRSAYDASAGFAGYRSNFNFYRRFTNWFLSIYGRYDNVSGAVFEDSPLVAKNSGLTAGFLVTYFFLQSKQTIKEIDWKYEQPLEK